MPCSASHRPPASTHAGWPRCWSLRRPDVARVGHEEVRPRDRVDVGEVRGHLDPHVLVLGEQLEQAQPGVVEVVILAPADEVGVDAPFRAAHPAGTEGERDERLVGHRRRERHDGQLHRHADLQLVRRDVDEERLDLDLTGQLDVPDWVRLEVDRPFVRRRLRPEALDRPRPQCAGAAQQVLADVRAGARWDTSSCAGKFTTPQSAQRLPISWGSSAAR